MVRTSTMKIEAALLINFINAIMIAIALKVYKGIYNYSKNV